MFHGYAGKHPCSLMIQILKHIRHEESWYLQLRYLIQIQMVFFFLITQTQAQIENFKKWQNVGISEGYTGVHCITPTSFPKVLQYMYMLGS